MLCFSCLQLCNANGRRRAARHFDFSSSMVSCDSRRRLFASSHVGTMDCRTTRRDLVLRRYFVPEGFQKSWRRRTIPQGIAVGNSAVDQPLGILSRTVASGSRHGDLLQSRFDQRAFMRRRRGKLDSERHTLAVCHHHKLRTLSAFGLADLGTPFLPRPTSRRRRPRANRVGARHPTPTGSLARRPAILLPLLTLVVDANTSSPTDICAADLSRVRRCEAPIECLPCPRDHQSGGVRREGWAYPWAALFNLPPLDVCQFSIGYHRMETASSNVISCATD